MLRAVDAIGPSGAIGASGTNSASGTRGTTGTSGATGGLATPAFPGFVRAVVGSEVRLDLATPVPTPPHPWMTTFDGRQWSAPMAELQGMSLPTPAGPDHGTVVVLGSSPDGTVVVDLRRALGPIAIVGAWDARLAVVRRVVDQVRAHPWSAGTAVLSVGLARTAVPGAEHVSVSGAVAAVAADAQPGLVVLTAIPGGSEGRELRRLLDRPGGRWAVLVVRSTDGARWVLDARRDGALESDVLGTMRWTDVPVHEPAAASPPAGRQRGRGRRAAH